MTDQDRVAEAQVTFRWLRENKSALDGTALAALIDATLDTINAGKAAEGASKDNSHQLVNVYRLAWSAVAQATGSLACLQDCETAYTHCMNNAGADPGLQYLCSLDGAACSARCAMSAMTE